VGHVMSYLRIKYNLFFHACVLAFVCVGFVCVFLLVWPA
jgi:hypothetical protein